nr:NAD(P)/FAD-dependent oxidoreductase [Actinomycetota bacterium]
MSDRVFDITIVGAGPVGLAAAYYAGHREATACIVESLEQLGGQVGAVYPEKHVFDVAGHPKVLGQNLVDLCAEQGLQFGAEVFLGEEVSDLRRVPLNGEEILSLTTQSGRAIQTRAIIVTAGHGAFE